MTQCLLASGSPANRDGIYIGSVEGGNRAHRVGGIPYLAQKERARYGAPDPVITSTCLGASSLFGPERIGFDPRIGRIAHLRIEHEQIGLA
jgi:hypothetical protein